VLGVALFFLFLALLLGWLWARGHAGHSGLPAGDVVYQDIDRYVTPAQPLRSRRYALRGRPDYLISRSDGIIPVELKKSRCPINLNTLVIGAEAGLLVNESRKAVAAV
jgi:hypothetical protein